MNSASRLPLRALALSLAVLPSPLLAAQEFGPRRELTADPGEILDAEAGDFNGDGFVDLMTTNPSEVLLYLGGPSGTFPSKLTILTTTNENVQRVGQGDLDGDGDLDIFYNAGPNNRLYRLENLGGGTFGPQANFFAAVANPSSLNTADLDGDGNLDIYTSTPSNGVLWFRNLGGFQFAPVQVLGDSGGTSNTPRWVDAGDLDGDGDLDLLAAMADDSTLALWENLGGGAFGPRQAIANTAGPQIFVQFTDLNGDGDLDVVTVQSSAARWHQGDGTGSLGPGSVIGQNLTAAFEAEVADLDGDGKPDLVLGSSGQGPLSWFPNQSTLGTIGFGPQAILSSSATGLSDFPVIDVDDNGTLDVVTASPGQQGLSWISNLGFGLFGVQTPISSVADNAREALLVDLDGDGQQDVVSLSTDDRKLGFYGALGNGDFAPQQTLATVPPNQVCMDIGDLDGDGSPDLVVGGLSPNVLAWYRNLGNGQLAPPLAIPAAALDAAAVHVVDLDADGFQDVLLASENSGSILWIPGTAGQGFGPAVVVSDNPQEATSVMAADMDQDGDLDVLYTAKGFSTPERIAWRENTGGGSFGSTTVVNPGGPLANARDAIAADVDRDGIMDVIACGNRTSWFRGLVGGGYAFDDLIVGGFTRCIDASDVDGDGDFDVLVAKNNDLTWHRRTGFGGYSLPKLLEEDLQDPRSARFADVDGDGDPDVLFADGLGGSVQWYENLMDPSIGVADCDPAVPNSTGLPAQLSGIGSPWVPNNALVLAAGDLPANQVGLFLASPDAGFVSGAGGSQGNLCLSGPIGRFREPGQVQSSGPEGSLSLDIDLTQIPSPSGFLSVLMGEQWHFQVWYRDLNPGPTSNFTNGLVIDFQ